MIIIPAIDLKDGKCVRLKQGQMNQSTIFSENPAAMAKKWLDLGAKRLHLVDLDGAFAGKPVNEGAIKSIVSEIGSEIPIQLGGGIRNLNTVENFLNSGVDSNKLNLGWNVDTTQTSFIINYGPAGYDPVTNPTGGNTTTSAFNFVSVTGLNPLTEYCFWIKAVCTNGDTSAWAGPFCGETGCPSSTGTPYFQNFANYTNTDLPICWQEAQGVLGTNSTLAYGTSNWGPDGFGNVGTTGAARMNLYSTNRYEWLVSPSINLGTNPSGYHIIEFDIALTDYANSTAGVVGVDDSVALVVSYNDGLTWSTTDILQLFDTGNAPSNTGDHIIYTLRNQTGVVKFGFYAASSVSNEDNDWFIDNFSIRDTVFAGIDEIDEVANFRIFPNPNNGQFTILNEGSANKSSVKVIDIQGRVVYDEAYYFNHNGRKQVDLTKLNSGVYILILQGEGRQEQHRIILNK